MIELYISDRKVDIKDNVDISLTYEMNDLSNPQAVKSAYSKTVSLEGTPTNNAIFSHIYKLDKEILDSNERLIGLNFNPNKRVECYVVKNGEVLDSGYMHLDKITSSNGVIKYDITMFLGIGDFFYNLMYADETEDENRTLGSLHYGINGMSKEEEDMNKNLFEYDKDFIKECWRKRINNDVDDNDMHSIFCPIPTHSGYYDDFKSDTVLTVEENGIPTEIEVKDGDETKTYTRQDDFALVTASRELDEWEIGDLRSHYQRMGVRMQSIYDAIKNPQNNGGYVVDDSQLDAASKDYIKDGYLVLDRFDYESINQTNKNINLTMGTSKIEATFNTIQSTNSSTFDVTDYVNPHITVSIVPQAFLQTDTSENDEMETLFFQNKILKWEECDWYESYSQVLAFYEWTGDLCFASCQVFYLTLYDENGNKIKDTTAYPYGSYKKRSEDFSSEKFLNIINGAKERIEKEIKNKIGNIDVNWSYFNQNNNEIGYQKNVNIAADEGKEFVAPKSIQLTSDLPKNCTKVKLNAISLGTKFVTNAEYYLYDIKEFGGIWGSETPKPEDAPLYTEFSYWDEIDLNTYDKYNKNYMVAYCTDVDTKKSSIIGYKAYGNINNTAEDITQVYDGTIVSTAKRHVLNKKQIFAETETPFDYLISLGKTFNWVFEKDVIEKKINIYSKFKYYDKVVKDISDLVDRQSYEITPSTLEYNRYLFNLNLEDTYQTELFKKKNNRIYSQFIYKPNYQFSSESLEVLEDCKFNIAIPYLMHSIYFTPIDNLENPRVTYGSYSVTLWNQLEDDTTEKKFQGKYMTTNNIVESDDLSEKICCFDKDNQNANLTNIFVLYNGYTNVPNNNSVYVSNDCPLTEQLAEGNCYLMTQGNPVATSITSSEKVIIQDKITQYPNFGNVTRSGNSLLFNEEEGTKDLWNRYFKNDFTNIYSKNSKILKIKYRLIEQPYKALRHYYLIDNTLWMLNKISDFKPNQEGFTECSFVKLTDYQNYCKSVYD